MEFVYKQSPAYLVNILSRLFNQALASRLAPHNTTPAQLPVLLSLWQKDGQTQSELCRRMRIEQPTLANTLKRMVRDRLVRKVPDSNDRRQTLIKLTQRGKDLKPTLTASALEVHTTAMRGLTQPGLETMLLMINKIISNLDADLTESPLVLEEMLDPIDSGQVLESERQPLTGTPPPEPGETTESDPGKGNEDGKDGADEEDDSGEQALVLREVDIVRD